MRHNGPWSPATGINPWSGGHGCYIAAPRQSSMGPGAVTWLSKLLFAKERLNKLKTSYKHRSLIIAKQEIENRSDLSNLYPTIPMPSHLPSPDAEGIPYASGIYFLWDGDEIVYVGQSVRLCNRLRLNNHHIMQCHYKISFIFFEKKELTFAENYYIGIARPKLNYGSLNHYRN